MSKESQSPLIPVLSIAGSDPSGGAGIQLDTRVFLAHRCYPMSIPAVLTVQSPSKVLDAKAVSTDLLIAQLQHLLECFAPKAIKLGALGNVENARAIAQVLGQYQIPLVLDPVFRSTADNIRLSADVTEIFTEFSGRITLCTPNIEEAQQVLGFSINSIEQMQSAAKILSERIQASVLLSGGHLEEEGADEIIDVSCIDGEISLHRAKRLPGLSVHGSGCALSSSIAAQLALGTTLHESIAKAIRWVQEAMKSAWTPLNSENALFAFDCGD